MTDNNSNNDQFHLPRNFEIGHTILDSNCFFDSFLQGLKRFGTNENIHILKNHCEEFAKNNPPGWFLKAIEDSRNQKHNSVNTREKIEEYILNIQKGKRWGDPDIEGRILCKRYGVLLYVIKKQETNSEKKIYAIQLIDGHRFKSVKNVDFTKQNCVYMISRKHGYFEPIINEIQTSRTTIWKSLQVVTETTQSTITNSPRHNNLDPSIKKIVIDTYNKFKNTIKIGNVERLKKLINFLYRIVDKNLLMNIYEDEKNSIRHTSLITLACEHNQPLVLDFLLNKTNILCYLPNHGSVAENSYMQAICATIRSSNIDMLEMLYNYWTSDIHWLGTNRNDANSIINNLQQMKTFLMKAQMECKAQLLQYEQLNIDVQCLICFNNFQIELYSKLSELKRHITHADNVNAIRKNEVEVIASILLTAIHIYDKYANINIIGEIPSNIQTSLGCPESICSICYLQCDVYYSRLNHNIALLIVNNLHLLKLRLAMTNDIYQEIESAIYQHLYCVNENWNFYIPDNTPKYRDLVLSGLDNNLNNQSIALNYFNCGMLIYKEWRNYLKAIRRFETVLKNTVKNIDENYREKGTELPNEEIQSLLLLPNMRDDYSLKKILQYMEKISYVDFKKDKTSSLLIIERVIQITGEFLKGTEQTYHLSPTTLALLKAEIPKHTLKNLSDLRHHFSHTKEGKLIRKIELELNESYLFENVLNDLQKVKNSIMEVLKVYTPVNVKFILQSDLEAMNDAYSNMPKEVTMHRDAINIMLKSCNEANTEDKGLLYGQMEKDLAEKLKITGQQIRTIWNAEITISYLEYHVEKRSQEILFFLMHKLPKYTSLILQSIDLMESDNLIWTSIKQDFGEFPRNITTMDYPKKDYVKTIKLDLEKLDKKQYKAFRMAVSKKLDTILKKTSDWIVQWVDIKNLIIFIGGGMDICKPEHKSLHDLAIHIVKSEYPDSTQISNVRQFISHINSFWQNYNQNSAASLVVQRNENLYEYKRLRSLADKLCVKLFLTKHEMDYLKNHTHLNSNFNVKTKCNHHNLIAKLLNNTVINEKEYEILMSLNVDKKCKKIITNLANGNTRDNSMLQCLVNRTGLLNTLLDGDRNLDELVLRYKQDAKFKIILEMIISDIMNIYVDNGLGVLANSNYTKLLAEYPLRHILDHGNPLLDVCSVTLDANDFPSAIIAFALHVINDEIYFNSLYKLYEDGVDRADVVLDLSNNLNNAQEKTLKKWRLYLKLWEDDHEKERRKQKKIERKKEKLENKRLAQQQRNSTNTKFS